MRNILDRLPPFAATKSVAFGERHVRIHLMPEGLAKQQTRSRLTQIKSATCVCAASAQISLMRIRRNRGTYQRSTVEWSMTKIFISYRRQDSIGVTGRIYDRLRAQFGDGAVFMDVDSIPIGVDFREHLDAAVGQCDVVLAVMGTKWAGETDARRRLDDPRDFVRIELESALNRNLPVIPILIDHASMPDEADLPPSLAQLAFRNAIGVDQGRDFHHHIDRLIRGIEFLAQQANKEASDREPLIATDQRINYIANDPFGPTHGDTALTSSSLREAERRFTNTMGMQFVRVEAGEFLMGTTKAQVDHLVRLFQDSKREYFDDEQPQHPVHISQPFFLGVHQVTQGNYQALMGNNPGRFRGPNGLPVENVSWLDAVGFCNKLSERESLSPFYHIDSAEATFAGGNGYRLPTEAEWEYACRANTATLFPFGDRLSRLNEHAWFIGNAGNTTHLVGEKLPNAWGFFDMLGNVWEWCADGYDEKYFASSPPADPVTVTKASSRVVRGGSWDNDSRNCRSAERYKFVTGLRLNNLGFRVARSEG
jgi:formylglycine-generating enzyme required for sulfatase activity